MNLAYIEAEVQKIRNGNKIPMVEFSPDTGGSETARYVTISPATDEVLVGDGNARPIPCAWVTRVWGK